MFIKNKFLNKILQKKILRFIKYFNIYYYNIFFWIYIIIFIFVLINFKCKYIKYKKYLLNFLFIILLLNKCQKSDLN
nr:hypothetical protein [Plasmodium sp.]